MVNRDLKASPFQINMGGDIQSSTEEPICIDDSMNCDAKEENEESRCPLFMDGLPKDFASNPALAAIANLLEEEPKDEEKSKKSKCQTVSLESGGGKACNRNRSLSRSIHRKKPYDIPKKPKATLGEAQLFLKMWKM